MKQETKTALINALELLLAELKEGNSVTIPFTQEVGIGYAPTVTTSTGMMVDYEIAIDSAMPVHQTETFCEKLSRESVKRSQKEIDEESKKAFDEEAKEFSKTETFWEKSQREGLEAMKNLSIDIPKDYVERKRLYEGDEECFLSEKDSIPEGVHRSSIHMDCSLIPDSEFILPAENVKSKSKKKK